MRVLQAGGMSKALTDGEMKGGRGLCSMEQPWAGMDVFGPNGVREGKRSRRGVWGPEPHPAMPVWESEQHADSPRLHLSTGWALISHQGRARVGGRDPP